MGLAERLLNTENAVAKVADFIPAIRSLVADLTSVSQDIKIYVFGSISQGTMTVSSDIDLLVILDSSVDKYEFKKTFYKIKKRVGFAVDLIFKTEAEASKSDLVFAIRHDLIEVFPNWKLNGQ